MEHLEANAGGQHFDGQLVAIIEGEIKGNNDFQLFWVDPEKAAVSQIATELLAYESMARKLRGISESREPLERLGSLRDASIAASGLNAELVEVLLNGRLQLSCLIDSIGGRSHVLARAENISTLIRANQGFVRAYGFGEISSTGAKIWDMADQGFVLDRTNALWHTGESVLGQLKTESDEIGREELMVMHREEREAIAGRFSKANGDWPSIIRNRVMDPNNPRGEVVFTGLELANMGIAAQAFPAVQDAARHFEVNTGLNVSQKSEDTNPVRIFWQIRLEQDRRQIIDSIFAAPTRPRGKRR